MISFTFETQRSVYWTSVTWCFVLLAGLCYSNGVPHLKTVKMEDPLQSTSESSTMADTTEQLETVAADLGSLLDAGDGAVVTLVAGDTRLAAHKAVLAAGSPVIAAMFQPGTLADSSTEVAIPDVEGPVLRQLVAYFYTGRAPQLPSMAPQLLAAADKYGVSALRDASEQQLLQHLDVESAAAAAVVAVSHSRLSLRKAAIAFVKAHILEVLPTQGWAEAVINHPREVVQIFRLLEEPTAETSTATATATATGEDSTPTHTAAPTATSAASTASPESAPHPTTAAGTPATPTATAETHSDLGWTAATTQVPTAGCGCETLLLDIAAIVVRGLSAEEKGGRLVEAAKQGRVPELRALLAAGAAVGARDGEKYTALHWAARNGDAEATRYLLQAGAAVGATDGNEYTALHWAARYGHAEAAHYLLQAGAAVGARDDWQKTPLHWAAINGHTAALRLLLAAGADVNARDNYGLTPLYWAADRGHAEVAAALLQAGADRAPSDKYGRTALRIARLNKHQQLVQMLQ